MRYPNRAGGRRHMPDDGGREFRCDPGATVWCELPLRRLRTSPPLRLAMPEATIYLPFCDATGGQRDAFYVPARSIDR
jgi:hypothetical protein